MPDLTKQVAELANRLAHDSDDLEESMAYYEATHRCENIGIATPPQMRRLETAVGWSRMYLDSIEERLDLESFRLSDKRKQAKDRKKLDPENPEASAEDDGGMRDEVARLIDWWQTNDLDEESGLAHLDALIYGRSYVTVAAPDVDAGDEDGVPIIRVESPLNMIAETDPRTRKVTRALRLYRNPDNEAEQWATLYLPDSTHPLKLVNGEWVSDGEAVYHNLGQVPVVPILNRERLTDRFGRSEIIPELRSFSDAASRTMMNMQAAAELMAVPQRILFGVDPESLAPNGSPQEILAAYMAQILTVADPEGKAQQFTAAELRNFVESLEELAKHVASYTGLPPQYLSFSSENPASADAIRASESRLVKKCERKARMYGGAWEQVMRLAVLIIDGEVDPEMNRLQAVWRDPSTPTYAAMSDGITKRYNAGQGIIPKKRARIDAGYTDVEIEQMEQWDIEDQADAIRLADLMAPDPEPGAEAGDSPAGGSSSSSGSSSTSKGKADSNANGGGGTNPASRAAKRAAT